jgi:hypothetical protein
MSPDAGGWLWLVIDVIFVVAFAVALFYGMTAWRRRRNRVLEEARDKATDRLYEKR